MTRRLSQAKPRLFLYLLALIFSVCTDGRAATVEQETLSHLNQLRGIRADQSAAAIDAHNKQMDNAWQFFLANKAQVLPTLRTQLKAELARDQPNDLILLDVGFFVYQNDGAEGKAVGVDALSRLNPRAALVVANHKELFDFAYAAARDHDPRVLPVIERAFLSSVQQLFIPQHALKLDATLICVFLYGAYGPESESVLRAKLTDKAVARRILEVLIWLGSPASLPEVRSALAASPDYETFVRATAYMMQAAGPAGRTFMLGLGSERLDPQSRQHLAKIRSAIRDTSFESARSSLTRIPGEKSLPDAEVSARLSAMIKNYGKDDRTSPLAILDSGLAPEVLIAELSKVRSSTLYRLSDEALSDVQVTNALINALRYKGK